MPCSEPRAALMRDLRVYQRHFALARSLILILVRTYEPRRRIHSNEVTTLHPPRTGELPFPVPQTQSTFHRLEQRNAFGRQRCASAIQIVRPPESIAETQPQP